MRKNKLLATLLLCVFVFGIMTTGVAAKPHFKDLNQATWAEKQVLKMKAKNIIMGYADGSFQPNKPVTQAEAVVMTLRAAGLQQEIDSLVADSVYMPFKDAASIPAWAKNAVALAVSKGYLAAGTSGSFQANKAASRQWVTVLVAKALGLAPADIELTFTDADKIAADTAPYVAAIVYNQLMAGYPDGSFKPNKPVTRAEIAVMLGISTDEMAIPGKIKNKAVGTVVAVDTQVYDAAKNTKGTITLSIKDDDEEKLAADMSSSTTTVTDALYTTDAIYGGVVKNATYPVSADAAIFVNDAAATLADVPVGARAQVVVNGQGVVVFIEVAPLVVRGVVTAVYNDQLTVVETKHKFVKNVDALVKVSYTFAANATVNINGKAAQIADLKAGDVVKLTLDSDKKITSVKAARFLKHKVKETIKDKIQERRNGKAGKDDQAGTEAGAETEED